VIRSLHLCPLVLSLVAAVTPLATRAEGADEARSRDDRIAALERQVQVLTDELGKLRTESAVPEEKPLEGARGYGPAASKVFGVARGLSIGGYGELNYVNAIADGDAPAQTDALRLVTYIGYKFNERIAFNSEIEYEHALAEEGAPGSVEVEFASLDFAWKPQLNFRAGLLLTPMGFINEVHEPPYFYGVFRPEAEQHILPSTGREIGAGVFGNVGEQVEYRAYVLTGFNAAGFEAEGIREGRQEGAESLAENFAFVGRLDVTPDVIPGLSVGGSFYAGKADQNQAGLPEVRLWIAETHAQYRRGPFHSRALFAYSDVSNSGDLSTALGLAADEGVANSMLGGYVELAYDIWPLLFGADNEHALEPFARLEYIDTQRDVAAGFVEDHNLAYSVLSTGLSYYPHPNVVLKAEYRNQNARSGKRPDEFALGLGFAY
jgi:hypothetical protein